MQVHAGPTCHQVGMNAGTRDLPPPSSHPSMLEAWHDWWVHALIFVLHCHEPHSLHGTLLWYVKV